MLTLDDIVNASFGKAGFSAGYRTEDVDDFLDEVKESYEELFHKYSEQRELAENAKKENSQLSEKIDVLVDCVEKYRNEENDIKSVLVEAHRTADISIKDAKQKSEAFLNEAKIQSESVLSEARIKSNEILREANEKAALLVDRAKIEAQSTISSIDREVKNKEKELEEIKEAVATFKSMLIKTYRDHITLIQSLPADENKEAPKAEVISVPSAPKIEITPKEYIKEEYVKEEKPAPVKLHEEPKVEAPIEEKEEISNVETIKKDEISEEEQVTEPFRQQQFMTQGIPNLSDVQNSGNFHSYDFNDYDFDENDEDERKGLFGKKHKKNK